MRNIRGEKVFGTFDVFDSDCNKIAEFRTDEDEYDKIVLQDGDKIFTYREILTHRRGMAVGYHQAPVVVKVSSSRIEESSSPLDRNCWTPPT